MRRLAMLLAIALVACTGSDDDPVASDSTSRSTDEAVVDASGPGSIPSPDDELPRLEDITTPLWVPETRTDELASEIDSAQVLELHMAIDAAAIVNPDFPGATPTMLPPGDGLGTSYTLWLLQQFRSKLTPEQLALLEEAENEEAHATIEVDGDVIIHQDVPEPPLAAGSFTGFAAPAQPVSETLAQRYGRLLDSVAARWKAQRPDVVAGITRFRMVLSQSWLVGTPRIGGMAANMIDDETCRVLVGRSFWSQNHTDDYIVGFYAHETFHCYQGQLVGEYRAPNWVREGTADWAAADLFRSLFPLNTLNWDWFERTHPLAATRGYEEWPIFELPLRFGSDPYSIAREMLLLPRGTSTEQYLALGQMDRLLFRMAWGSTSARLTAARNDDTWRFNWPGPAPDYGPHDTVTAEQERGIGTYDVKYRGKWTHRVLVIPMSRDVGIVTVTPSLDPITTVARKGTVTIAEDTPTRLCFAPDGCLCPTGSSPQTIQMSGPAMVFSHPPRATEAKTAMRAEKWDPKKHCQPEEENGRRTGRSYGDPHIRTFDGYHYDAMVLGEFVNARDPEGGFEVQARYEAASLAGATVATAIALGTDGHRVTFTFDQEGPDAQQIVRVNGEVTQERAFSAGDIDVVIGGDEAVATRPDGSAVMIHASYGWFFIDVTVSEARGVRLVGLLGSANDDLRDDLRTPDGTIAREDDTLGTEAPYVLAWQVDEASTLLDYLPGESIATFRIPHPRPAPPPISPEAREECAAGLGEEATEREIGWCAFDVTVSGNEEIIDTYSDRVDERVDEQTDDDEELILPDETTTTGVDAAESEAGEATLELAGTIAASYSIEVGPDVLPRLGGALEATAGSVLIARTANCLTDLTASLTVTHRSTDASTYVFLCDPTGIGGATADDDDEVVAGETVVWLASAGVYDVSLEIDREEAMPFALEVFVDPTPTIVDPGALAAGSSVVLDGVGDTAVFVLGFDDNTYAVEGLDAACAILSYGAPEVGGDHGPWPLHYCGHMTETVATGDADIGVPLIVWAQTADPVTVSLEPQP